MPQLFAFKDKPDGVYFEFQPTPPQRTIKFKIGNDRPMQINLHALKLYGLYKTAVYDSYVANPQLADDIKNFPKVYTENPGSNLSKSKLYNTPLHHYSIFACVDAMKEWLTQAENMQCYTAFTYVNGVKKILGFVHFVERTVNEKPVVYIAQAGVSEKGCSIGRRLMECVLSHYPANTEFYILTRAFNDDARRLYGERFHFTEIELGEIEQLGYDKRYCGFKCRTHETMVAEILDRKQEHQLMLEKRRLEFQF